MTATWPENAVRAALAEVFGPQCRILGRGRLSGGDINEAERLDTSAGPVFLKWNPAALPGLFSSEAAGLRALRACDSGLVVPEVLAFADGGPHEPGFLMTSFLEPGPRVADFDERLGLGLARLHATSRATYGFERDNYLGTTPQPNPSVGRWLDFYGEHRLGHQVTLARRKGLLSGDDVRRCERLVERLDHWLVDHPPALIHGDLWAGNLHHHQGRPALIDPAPYYGHPEAELGMMTLFGGFGPTVYAAYEQASGLASDWRQRQPLYQLYHLLNHANLFGGGYVSQSMSIVRRYAG